MTPLVKHKGLVAALEAAAWYEDRLLFLSAVGPREAVRGILAALSAGREVVLLLPQGPLSLGAWGQGGKSALARLPGGAHGVWHRQDLGQAFYVAREEDPRREALWASRRLGKPIPPSWWPEAREGLLLPSYKAVALRGLREEEYRELVERMVGVKEVAL